MTIKLIVGLANPGAEYAATRHNAGAWFVDLLAERLRAPLREEAKFFGYTSRVTLGGEDVRLLVPTTFMNLSGKDPDYIYESQRQSRCGDGQFFPH